MSAFFLAINRDQIPFDKTLAERMMRQLDRFGRDAKTLVVRDDFVLGYQSCWQVSQEEGERQPLVMEDGKWFMFHGRLDNRDQLVAELEAADQVDTNQFDSKSLKISDAELLKKYFIAFGESRVDRIIGPFVFIVFDATANTVYAARDAMGGRYLVYRITDQHVLIATYEMALVAHDSVAYQLNQAKAARMLLSEMEGEPNSLIDGLQPLNPGMSLTVDGGGESLQRYYQRDPGIRLELASDREYAAEFRRLLKQAVQRRMRGRGKVGLMLSGGMDSVPMTILAAENATDDEHELLAFSWVFDRYPELDERHYSSPVCQSLGLEQVMVDCDDLWPQFDETMDMNPIIPFGIPFTEFQEETFRQARARGVSVLLTGIHGDLLYEYTQGVLFELLRAGQFALACSEFWRLWNSGMSRKQVIKFYLLRPLRIVQKLSAWRRRNQRFSSEILAPEIADKLQVKPHWLSAESQAALRPQQWQILFDGFAGEDAAHGRYLDAKYGIERRYPFRDRELCEFILSIPSHQLYFELSARPIVKRAFEQEFTQDLLSRNDKTSFREVIYRGIETDQLNLKWFNCQPPQWQDYVKQCYFEAKSEQTGSQSVVRWRCGYYDYWKSVCYNLVAHELG